MKNLMTGTDDFKEFIDKNAYYVDKSQLIIDCVNEKCALYTRPRRFGKSLNMSMLYYFFSNQEKENAYLFDGLEVAKHPEVMKYQNQYPVILISLKDMIGENFQIQTEMFASLISKIVEKHTYLFESDALSDAEKKVLRNYQNKESSEGDLRNSLLNISTYLCKHYDQKVIILIDEYDVPLQNAYQYGYYDEMVVFLRTVFSSSLKSNTALEKGIMTGCLRIAKESIFTGLNNFNVYSILEDENDENFGFTEEEVKTMLEDYHLENCFDEVKEWYDGYLFGDKEIYNPWSTIKYVQKKIKKPQSRAESYWANTSGNDIVYNYIQNASPQLREEFEQLIQGKSIIKEIIPDLTYREMDDIDNIYSFLLLTGYLKIIKRIDDEYELVIPNKEVYEIYKTKFKKYFNDYKKLKKQPLYQALNDGDEKQVNRMLNDILFRDISYYDNQESFYHGFLTGLFSSDYDIESNRESGDGRFDLLLSLKDGNQNTAIIIECKHSREREDLVDDSEAGAKQIIDKRYLEDKRLKEYSHVVGYGIAFYKKRCYVTKVNQVG